MAHQQIRDRAYNPCKFVHLCIYFIIFILIESSVSGLKLQCNIGTLDNRQRNLLVTNCTQSQDKSLPKSANHCIIFRHYNSTGTDPKVTGNTLGITDFLCDYHKICEAKNTDNGYIDSVRYQGITGDVYCCKENNCNTLKHLNSWKPPQVYCYSGTSTQNSTQAWNTQACVVGQCMKTIDHPSGPKPAPTSTIYSCDVNQFCKENKITNNTCQNITQADKSQREICCCNTTNCNRPKRIGPQDVQPSHPLNPMPPHGRTGSDGHGYNWVFIGGLTAAALLFVFLTIIVIIVIRRCRQKQEEQFAYVYSQLTADLSEEQVDDSDTGLIIA